MNTNQGREDVGASREVDLFWSERLPLSVNGNPRFRLGTADGSYVTQSDASCSYDVENITRRIPEGGSVRVVLSLTRAGRVWNIERVAS